MEEQYKKIWSKEDEAEVKEKHAPVVNIEENEEGVMVDVKVGNIEHPSEAGHFIQWIEVLDGDISLTRQYLTHFDKPMTRFTLKEKPENPVVRIFCNLHGTWQEK